MATTTTRWGGYSKCGVRTDCLYQTYGADFAGNARLHAQTHASESGDTTYVYYQWSRWTVTGKVPADVRDFETFAPQDQTTNPLPRRD